MRLFYLFLISWTCGFSQAVDLSLDLNTGSSYPQHMKSKVHIKQHISGQDIEAIAQTQTDLIFKVRKQDNSIYQTEASYSNISMDMQTNINGKEMSLGRTKELVNQGIEQIINNPFQVTINSKGKIVKITPLDIIFEKAIRTIVKNNQKIQPISKPQQEQTLEQLKKSFGVETLTANLESLLTIFPKKRVQIGEKWTISSFLSNGMNTLITTEYILKEINPNYILISGKANIHTENERVTLEQGQTIFFSMNGEILSTIKLDPKTKWIKQAQMKQVIKGNTRTVGDRSHPEGITIPIDTTSEITIDNQ
ncbi:DUF6263 family protein [Capnocytophaga catalasegens]|uniref:Uncharacterized protein n=1 Tax=Capnocytophaga catalasegens TaxID=1004260 RepID=A0AAV5AT80_9FLAO|nr:DUF6263 family protein [Capnocytophaga catalasegens]GIZ14068.1 hypothetical protein RCZ03_00690 [Capnocytophaga catalasegens]GJM49066.1 hypothetical protein RCZ15_00420 [Capnocytophaga catalasegens]GJM52327.1 hypothetical protein RCZ16_06450 [Capnocytophaga catalasegens]